MAGIDRIAAERATHPDRGYDAEHDKGHYLELVQAATAYGTFALIQLKHPDTAIELLASPVEMGVWPWDAKHWKPGTPERNMEKAGALFAAALDSLEEDRG